MDLKTGSLIAAGLASAATASPQALPIDRLTHVEDARGIWKSDGYGYLLTIAEGRDGPRVYHHFDGLCVPLASDQDNPMDYIGSFRLDEKARILALRPKQETYEIIFDRLEGLPAECKPNAIDAPRTALDNFDAFVGYFRNHYAFFDVHNPDWRVQAQEFRVGLSEASAESDIIEPMIALLSTLKDGHVSINAVVDGDEGEFIAYPGPTLTAVQETFSGEGSPMAAFGRQYLRADIEQAILSGDGNNAANERIKYGVTSDDIGYIAIMSVGGFAGEPDASDAAELAALNEAMDEVIGAFLKADVKAVLIDLSVNRGGYDFLGRAIAGRFADRRRLAFSKFAGDAQDRTPQQMFVEPAEAPRYLGPVFVLTSDVTVSAAETFTMSLRALPNVTHVGSRTRGALSDVLE
ncbi:MAG: S41 family peptidase, partial [Pseudomonadota bacterium]